MYCSNCGKEIDDKAFICVHCGVLTSPTEFQSPVRQSNTVAVVGLIFGCIPPFFLVGFICSLIGLIVSKKRKTGFVPALIGLVLSVLFAVLYTALIVVAILSEQGFIHLI